MKWNIELSQCEITYPPKSAIKGKILDDFTSEFNAPIEKEDEVKCQFSKWQLFMDGTYNGHDFGAGVILITSEGRWISYVLRLEVKNQ